MNKYYYNNIPFLQINIIKCSSGVWFEVFNKEKPYNGFQTDSLTELSDYIENEILEVL